MFDLFKISLAYALASILILKAMRLYKYTFTNWSTKDQVELIGTRIDSSVHKHQWNVYGLPDQGQDGLISSMPQNYFYISNIEKHEYNEKSIQSTKQLSKESSYNP